MKKPRRDIVAVIFVRGNEVLLSRRPDGVHLAGYWEFPGGKVEAGEDLEVALRRECREEVGVRAGEVELLHETVHEYDERVVHLRFYICTEWSGQMTGREDQAIEWRQVSDLRAQDLPPANREVVRLLHQRFGA